MRSYEGVHGCRYDSVWRLQKKIKFVPAAWKALTGATAIAMVTMKRARVRTRAFAFVRSVNPAIPCIPGIPSLAAAISIQHNSLGDMSEEAGVDSRRLPTKAIQAIQGCKHDML